MVKYLDLYIEKTCAEIEQMVKAEVESTELTSTRESLLHLLFENRKHAKELLCELNAERTAPSK